MAGASRVLCCCVLCVVCCVLCCVVLCCVVLYCCVVCCCCCAGLRWIYVRVETQGPSIGVEGVGYMKHPCMSYLWVDCVVCVCCIIAFEGK